MWALFVYIMWVLYGGIMGAAYGSNICTLYREVDDYSLLMANTGSWSGPTILQKCRKGILYSVNNMVALCLPEMELQDLK